MKVLFYTNRFKGIEFILSNEVDRIEDESMNYIKGYNLVIWDSLLTPHKDKGSVLICVETGSIGESLSRVFKFKANAVIIVKKLSYELVDALGNLWIQTDSGVELMKKVLELYEWNRKSIRKESLKSDSYIPYDYVNNPEMNEFCEIIHGVSKKIENERGGRYFGNASTRCSKMFPSIRSKYDKYGEGQLDGLFEHILVSKRNISKKEIQPDDFVVTRYGSSSENVGKVLYFGDDKPSVDTPSQIWLYQKFPNINYMIHGHAYLKSKFMTFETEKYCSCGDLNEVEQIVKCVKHKDSTFFVVNLKNHGFIIGTDTLDNMKRILEETEFFFRNIGYEKVNI